MLLITMVNDYIWIFSVKLICCFACFWCAQCLLPSKGHLVKWCYSDTFESFSFGFAANHICQLHQFTLPLKALGYKLSKALFTLQATQSYSFQWRAADFRRQVRQRPWMTGWGVSSDATKFRILQLYANEEWLSGAIANRKEDGRAHVIVLLSAVDKHTQWKKLGSVSHSFLFVCTDLIRIYIRISLLPPKCLYLAVRNLIRCQGNQ